MKKTQDSKTWLRGWGGAQPDGRYGDSLALGLVGGFTGVGGVIKNEQ